MGFQLSPGVVTSEIDLTTVVPAPATSTGAFAGYFNWGPVGTAVSISDEIKLVSTFGKPDSNTATSFFSAANFLSYSNDLRVVRAYNQGTSNNAVSFGDEGEEASYAPLVKNEQDFFDNFYNVDNIGPWIARYPGELGNSLKVIAFDSDNTSNFNNWEYSSYFNSAPGTSAYCEKLDNGLRDEFHMVVVDEDGVVSGTKGTVLEVFPYLSKASDAKDEQGTSIYYKDVLYKKSKYIYATGLTPQATATCCTWGLTASYVLDAYGSYITLSPYTDQRPLSLGKSGTLVVGDYMDAYDVFRNTEQVDISLIISGEPLNSAYVQNIIEIAETRADCVAFISPPLSYALGQGVSSVDAIVEWRNDDIGNSSSYAVMDSGWKYQYDKYNDAYRWIPLNADIAGLCARTDQVRDPWFSPAGTNRGAVKNVVRLAFNPTKAERDTLYKNGINPVVSFPGEGVLLFGDKTLLNKPSAFDRINVRRLFIVLEKAISRAARAQLFEFNDEFTRAQFVSIVDPFLRDVKGRRGIYDFKVVCDTTNNTPEVIDSNQFVGDIYIKPARSINFIQLNFVAVRTGVAFEEVVGKF